MSKFRVIFEDVDGDKIGTLLGVGLMPGKVIVVDESLGAVESGEASADETASKISFWMVFREGGRSPEHKHADVASASKEAERICRESGCKTYVLSAIEEHLPHRMPTWEEIVHHAESFAYPVPPSGPHFGLWRVTCEGEMARIVGAGVGFNSRVFFTSDGGRTMFTEDQSFRDAEWFPLDANGKDIDDEIPF